MKNRIVSWLSLYTHSGRPAQEAALNDAAYVLLKDIYPVIEIHDELLEALKLGLSKRHPTKESSALLISLGWDGGATMCANDFVNKLIHAAIAKAEGK